MNLPRYIIERYQDVWYLYDTETCESLAFETRAEAELFLNELLNQN